jgi:uncharacterized protein YdeI (YjbR/CyaY-like superfamily)
MVGHPSDVHPRNVGLAIPQVRRDRSDRSPIPDEAYARRAAGNVTGGDALVGTLIGVVLNPEVDAYIRRSEKWPEEMTGLRPILLSCGLTEEIKWGKPCYSHEGSNIVIIQEMKDFLALMFFKGALLNDPAGVLEEQGPNSRSARRIRFTSAEDLARLAETVTAYVDEAIDVEEAGLEVGPPPELALVDELQHRLDRDPTLKTAFEALTPGRQREYNLHFSNAKQASTREARVEKCAQKILDGKGFRDR